MHAIHFKTLSRTGLSRYFVTSLFKFSRLPIIMKKFEVEQADDGILVRLLTAMHPYPAFKDVIEVTLS